MEELSAGKPIEQQSLHFIQEIIEDDLRNKKNDGIVYTRFPPEPNGYLHIGHAKSICLNFGLARQYNGKCNLRFDDTNPTTEETEYVDSIMEDVQWLGFQWEGEPRYASDYFEQLYRWAEQLINKGVAYVCEMTAEEISASRGTPTIPGKESPWRNRPVAESLDLFRRMRAGEFPDGRFLLRAKIDMASPNMHMRDPVMYRIRHAMHHRTGDKWCIYPMYDWAHGQSDFLEGITHSICTLEFEVHRPLYDWFLNQITDGGYRPRQIEFARLNLTYTVMSKRRMLELVREKIVDGWDDPRMPTICGLRRRGYTPGAIRNFAERVGVAKRENMIDVGLLEFCIREELNKIAPRVMAVINPLKVVVVNYPEDKEEWMEAENNPEDPSMGTRKVPFSREIYIEKDDFMEIPTKKFFRLAPGTEVRLKNAYIIKYESHIKDNDGNISTIYCTCDFESRSHAAGSSRKVKGTLHWVSVKHAMPAVIRLYDRLFTKENPSDVEEGKDYKDFINPQSLKVMNGFVEPGLIHLTPGTKVQFQRLGYFCVDTRDSRPGAPVFNRTVTLKDTWSKIVNKE